MERNVFDVLCIFLSGILSYSVSVANPDSDRMELGALVLMILPALVALVTFIVYLVIAIFFKKFYKKNHWLIVGILCSVNLIFGLLMHFNILTP